MCCYACVLCLVDIPNKPFACSDVQQRFAWWITCLSLCNLFSWYAALVIIEAFRNNGSP